MAAERVLITGGAGFIGSRLAASLTAAGHSVRVLDNLLPQVHGDDPDASATYRAVRELAEVQRGSVTSREDLQRAVDGVDVVVHLAAETGTGQSMYRIAHYAEVNVGGTALLLDVLAERAQPLRRIVVASSRAVYGEGRYRAADGTVVYPPQRSEQQLAAGRFEPVDPRDGVSALQPVPTDESSALAPISVYGVTKLSQEQLVLTAAPALGASAVALRYQNVYGPGQALRNPYTGILSIFSTLIRTGAEINIFEDGRESRDFVYIDDVVAATVAAIEREEAAGLAINVGSGVATDVLAVVAELERGYRVSARSRVSGDWRLGDIRHNVADLTLARRVLGFEPRVGFAEGIARFTEWVLTEPADGGDYERSLAELRERNLLK